MLCRIRAWALTNTGAGTPAIVCFVLHYDPTDGDSPEGSQSKTSEADYKKLKEHICARQTLDYFFNACTGKALPVCTAFLRVIASLARYMHALYHEI